MPSKKSGGKRAVEKKHRERAASRKRAGGYEEQWLESLADLGAPPSEAEKAHAWLARAAVKIVNATIRDTAIPPEQMRRDAMKQIEQASKVLDPAKVSEQLEELERAVEELKNAGDLTAPKDRATSARTDLL